MPRYIKKPIPIEAFQWTGDKKQEYDPEWMGTEIKAGNIWFNGHNDNMMMIISTAHGIVSAELGDWVLRNSEGLITVLDHIKFTSIYDIKNEN